MKTVFTFLFSLATLFSLNADGIFPPVTMPKIYCAGPLFNEYEREMMADIAKVFEEKGFPVFLPHRDGIEYNNVIKKLETHFESVEVARQLLQYAIFDIDAYQVAMGCDAVVCSLNGRVPDEGAVSECAIAWVFQKPVLYYKSDSRGLGKEGGDNSLVMGLSQFEVVSDMESLPSKLMEKMSEFPNAKTLLHPKSPALKQLNRGEYLWNKMSEFRKNLDDEEYVEELKNLLIELYCN